MASTFQELKLRHLFTILDTNGDGSISVEDYVDLPTRMAILYDIDLSSERYHAQLETYRAVWGSIAQLASVDMDGRVEIDQFVKMYAEWLKNREAVVPMLSGLVESSRGFTANGETDWKISRREWLLTMYASNLSYMDANASFNRLDRDHDGYLQRSEMLINAEEFFYSDDPEAPGNWFFGPLPSRAASV